MNDIDSFSYADLPFCFQSKLLERCLAPSTWPAIYHCHKTTVIIITWWSFCRNYMFKQCHRTKFWVKAFTEEHYKSLATKAIKELVSFQFISMWVRLALTKTNTVVPRSHL